MVQNFVQLYKGSLNLYLYSDSETSGVVDIEWADCERIIYNTGIENIGTQEANLFYPNPAKGIISFYEKADYLIYNISGELIKTLNNTQTADLSNLSKGIYLIKNKKGNNQKLIVQ